MKFLIKKAVFLNFFAVILLIFNINSALAKISGKFLVENVDVVASSDSPALARNTAFTIANKKAFEILLKRLGLVSADLSQIDNDEINSLVRSNQVLSEKIYGNNYQATLNIGFAKDMVEDFLEKKNMVSSNENAKDLEFLLIPVEIQGQNLSLFDEKNDFRAEILIQAQNYNEFKVIKPDIENLANLNKYNITKVQNSNLQYLFPKYNVDVAYLAFYSYDRNIKKASVLIRGFEKNRKFQYRLGFINSENLPNDLLMQKVTQKVLSYLSSLGYEDIVRQGISGDSIRVEIPINGLSHFLQVKNHIQKSRYINKLQLQSISRDYAVVVIETDNAFNVSRIFESMGYSLKNKGINYYLLKY